VKAGEEYDSLKNAFAQRVCMKSMFRGGGIFLTVPSTMGFART